MNARNLTRSALAAGLICVLVFFALSRPLEDFVAYWTAAHLFVAHKNPYSLIEVNQFQAPLGWKQPIPLMFLNPPWTLPLIAPVGFAKSYSLAWLAWVGMLATVLVVSSRLLLNLYSGDVAIPEISDTPLTRSLLLFSFYPVLLCLRFSQTSPLPLLGLAAFLWFESREQPIPAGISLGLLALKPHLVYLVLLAVILRCLQRGIWSIVASATAVVSLLTILAVLVDHRVMREYWELSVGPYLQLQPSAMGAICVYRLQATTQVGCSLRLQLLGSFGLFLTGESIGRTGTGRNACPLL